MLVLLGTHTIKAKINQFEMVQCRAAKFITKRQLNTSSYSDMLQCLNWCRLEDRRRNARLVKMYSENVVITETKRLKPLLR